MDMTDAALAGLSLASSSAMVEYGMRMAKMAMETEEQSAAQMLDMLPQLRGPQPGDTPAIPKGSYFDTYA